MTPAHRTARAPGEGAGAKPGDMGFAARGAYEKVVDDAIWSLDADGRFSYISDSVTAATGWAPSDFVGRHFSEFTDPETLARPYRLLNARDPSTPAAR